MPDRQTSVPIIRTEQAKAFCSGKVEKAGPWIDQSMHTRGGQTDPEGPSSSAEGRDGEEETLILNFLKTNAMGKSKLIILFR